jgi:uncharacterized protein (TIRG00374 family)
VAAPENKLDDDLQELVEPTDQVAEEQLSIGRRLTDWKTILSFGFAVAVLAVVILKGGIDPVALWSRIRRVNVVLFLAAFLVYYATFPIRGFRWKILLKNAYPHQHSEAVDSMSVRGLSEILYISWFVNCIVPAKLGDLYRAYLVKLWKHISWTKTVGTIMAERIMDILVLSLLMAATGVIVFHNKLGRVSVILLMGVGLALLGIAALVLMKMLSQHIRRRLPARFVDRYIAFEEGTLQSFRRLPLLLGLTLSIWLLEGARIQFVFSSLGVPIPGSSIPFAPMLFFALAMAVLTTVPFTPGGLGLVEVGLGSLMIYLGLPKADTAAALLMDRVLSYYSVAFFGFLVYLLSKRTHFRHPV